MMMDKLIEEAKNMQQRLVSVIQDVKTSEITGLLGRLINEIETKDKEIEADNRNTQDSIDTIEKLTQEIRHWRRLLRRL